MVFQQKSSKDHKTDVLKEHICYNPSITCQHAMKCTWMECYVNKVWPQQVSAIDDSLIPTLTFAIDDTLQQPVSLQRNDYLNKMITLSRQLQHVRERTERTTNQQQNQPLFLERQSPDLSPNPQWSKRLTWLSDTDKHWYPLSFA